MDGAPCSLRHTPPRDDSPLRQGIPAASRSVATIEDVAQAVGDELERQGGRGKEQSWPYGCPRLPREVAAGVLQDVAPAGCRQGNAEAEVTERSLDEEERGRCTGTLHRQAACEVGYGVAQHLPGVRGAKGACSRHVLGA